MLCVGEPENGPSLPVIEELMRKHPSVDVKIFQGTVAFINCTYVTRVLT